LRGPVTSKKKPNRNLLKKIIRNFFLKFFFFKNIDYFFYLGKASYKEYIRLGVNQNRLIHTYYTVDYQNFEFQKKIYSRKKSRKDLGINNKTFTMIIVGAINERKNHQLLLKAIELSKYKNNFHLLIVGDGPMKELIVSYSKKLNFNNITFTGFVNQSQLGKYYIAADLFIFPSLFDSWGLVLNEAIQFGLPVLVSSNVSSSDDLVKEGKNGFIFDPNDHIDLSKKIDNIYNSKLRKEMSNFSLSLSENYSAANSANKLVDDFKSIIKK